MGGDMLESKWRTGLAKRIEKRFPNCFIIKLDPATCPGIPDLLVLIGVHWFMLETKRSSKSTTRPNQSYYVDFFNTMSFAAFINPENEELVLDELERALWDK